MRLRLPIVPALALCALLLAAPAARAQTHPAVDEHTTPHAGGEPSASEASGEHASDAAASLVRTPRPAGAALYFVTPKDGETVRGPLTVRFGLAGMGVAPAGVATPDTGHHHLVLDAPTPPLDAPLPSNDQHRHFGGGQTEVTLTLPPGRHELQLILADKDHVPHDPPLVSDRIAITVE